MVRYPSRRYSGPLVHRDHRGHATLLRLRLLWPVLSASHDRRSYHGATYSNLAR